MDEREKKEQALDEVFEAIKVINTSLRCYYCGEQHMFRAMAAQLRILFCDTYRRKDNSLIAGAFSSFALPRVRPAAWLPPGSRDLHPHLRRLRAVVHDGVQARFAKMPFAVTEYKNGLVVADLDLDDDGPLVPIGQWPDQLVTAQPAQVSIRDVIRLVADKGGGAHVDLAGNRELDLMRQAQPAAGVGQHVLFTVALARLTAAIGVHLEQLREQGGLDGHLPDFQPDPTHASAAHVARIPKEVTAGGASRYYLCAVRVGEQLGD